MSEEPNSDVSAGASEESDPNEEPASGATADRAEASNAADRPTESEEADDELDEHAATGEQPGDVTRDLTGNRTTAPMSHFTSREATIGFAVLALGVVLAFVVPVLASM